MYVHMYRCMFVGCFARPGDVTQVWLYILSTSELVDAA